jgi:hypothetical protein
MTTKLTQGREHELRVVSDTNSNSDPSTHL